MAKYFNVLRSSMAVQLVGKSVSIPSKGVVVLEGEDESAPAVVRALAQGKLKKLPEAPPPPPEPEKAPWSPPPVIPLTKEAKPSLKPGLVEATPGDIKDKPLKPVKAVEKAKEKVENIATSEVSVPGKEGANK